MIGRILAAALALGLISGEALAGRDSYCRAYARDVANHRNGGGDILAGALGGAATGAVLGGIIDGGEGAGKGAIIGGVGGTLLGAAIHGSGSKKAYKRAYRACMEQYEPEAVYYEKPRSRNAYCAAKFRSYNPETGMYRTSSGRLRACR